MSLYQKVWPEKNIVFSSVFDNLTKGKNFSNAKNKNKTTKTQKK